MTSPFVYDFGYGWPITWIHTFPLVLGLAAAALGLWLGWRRWVVVLSGVIGIWGVVGTRPDPHDDGRPERAAAAAVRAIHGLRPRTRARRRLRIGPRADRPAAGPSAGHRHRARHLQRLLRHHRQHARAPDAQREDCRGGRPRRHRDGGCHEDAAARRELRRGDQHLRDRSHGPGRQRRGRSGKSPACSSRTASSCWRSSTRISG